MNKMLMRSAVCALALCMCSGQGKGERPYNFARWQFQWEVARAELATLFLVMEPDSAVFVLQNPSKTNVRMTPEQAQKVAKELERAEWHASKVRPGDATTIMVDGIQMIFGEGDSEPYIVGMKEGSGKYLSITDGVVLAPEEIEMAAKHLAKAKAMAAYVDRKIDL